MQPNWAVGGNPGPVYQPGVAEGSVTPRVDILATPQEILYLIEVPGARPEEVRVEIHQHSLSVQGPLHDYLVAGSQYLYQERPRGSFARWLSLPPEADAEQAAASFRHGLLEVRFPRKSDSRRLNVASPTQ